MKLNKNKKTKHKIAIIGRTKYLYKSAIDIKKKGYKIVLIITCREEADLSHSIYEKGAADFKRLAKIIGCDFLETENINMDPRVKKFINENRPDIAISMNWKTLIGEEVIKSFPLGIINAHAGDLPRYRGNAIPNWAIINGEREAVLTLHLMGKKLDSGPIVLKKRMPINDKTYVGEIYKFLFEQNLSPMLIKAIEGLITKRIKPKRQPTNPKLSLRCYPRSPRDSEIDWKRSAIEISRLIRASAEPFFGAYSFLKGDKLIVWRAHPEMPKFPFWGMPGQVVERRLKTGGIAVITGQGLFILEEIETEKEGRRKATDIIKSVRNWLGFDSFMEIQKLKKIIKRTAK